MNDITIVTAFFDIGRGDWTPDKNLPHYLQRTTKTYLERFGHLAKLENDMVIYTSKDLVDDIQFLRQDRPTSIMTLDFPNSFKKLREEVSSIQNNKDYLAKINPMQIRNPEYWNADYVVVNSLKSSFVKKAIEFGHVETDLIAWLDFGYCRDEQTLNGVTHWQYPFDKEKIHLFNIKDWVEETYIQDVIANNDVHITGPCIVADKKLWPLLEGLVNHSIEELLKNNLIDDDQTLLLMSYLLKPELFELHRVSDQDWFVAFKEYNEDTSE
jgi:protein YibB